MKYWRQLKALTVVSCIRATGVIAILPVRSGSREGQTTCRILATTHGLEVGYQQVELQVHRRKQVGTVPRPGNPIIATQGWVILDPIMIEAQPKVQPNVRQTVSHDRP